MRRDLGLVGRDLVAVSRWIGRRRALVELPGCVSHASPDDARFVTRDVEHFYLAFDEARRTRNFGRAFREVYFAAASPGLREFVHRRPEGFAKLARAVRARQKFYESARSDILELAHDEGWKARARAAYRDLRILVPRARFVDTTLAVGWHFAGGTAGLGGLLLSAEFFAPNADTRELGAWQRANLSSAAHLPFLVVHEFVHVLQRRSFSSAQKPTVLDRAIYEGTPDFVASLVLGQPPSGAHHAFGALHERDVWRAFEREMLTPRVSNWFYQGDRARGVPADLGYFVGHQIARAYFERTGDLAGLLDVKDPLALLRTSGYAPS